MNIVSFLAALALALAAVASPMAGHNLATECDVGESSCQGIAPHRNLSVCQFVPQLGHVWSSANSCNPGFCYESKAGRPHRFATCMGRRALHEPVEIPVNGETTLHHDCEIGESTCMTGHVMVCKKFPMGNAWTWEMGCLGSLCVTNGLNAPERSGYCEASPKQCDSGDAACIEGAKVVAPRSEPQPLASATNDTYCKPGQGKCDYWNYTAWECTQHGNWTVKMKCNGWTCKLNVNGSSYCLGGGTPPPGAQPVSLPVEIDE